MALSTVEIVAFVCMIEWGIIHIAAFFMISFPAWSDKLGPSGGSYAAYDLLMQDDKYKKEYDEAKHPRLSGKILWQHGFNLGWCGLFAGVGVPLCIFYENRMAWVMTLVPFLADVGYFVAFDLFKLGGGMAQAQTYIVSIGSIMTALSVHDHWGPLQSDSEFYITIIVPSLLIFFGLLEKLELTDSLLKCCGANTKADYDAMGPRVGNEVLQGGDADAL